MAISAMMSGKFVSVAQWIERHPPEVKAQVRVLSGTPIKTALGS